MCVRVCKLRECMYMCIQMYCIYSNRSHTQPHLELSIIYSSHTRANSNKWVWSQIQVVKMFGEIPWQTALAWFYSNCSNIYSTCMCTCTLYMHTGVHCCAYAEFLKTVLSHLSPSRPLPLSLVHLFSRFQFYLNTNLYTCKL